MSRPDDDQAAIESKTPDYDVFRNSPVRYLGEHFPQSSLYPLLNGMF